MTGVKKTQKTATICGDIIHIKQIEVPRYYDYVIKEEDKKNRKGKQKSEEKRIDNIYRAKATLRDLINCNVNQGKNADIFLTLTYKDNMQDVDKAKKDFKKFIMRWDYKRKKILKDKWESLKYVYVIEFQKRGAVHFHCIFFNLEKVKLGKTSKDSLFNIWGFGSVNLNKIEDVDNVGAYVVKYMEKELEDKRLSNKDLYGRSKGNLLKPIEIKNPQEVEMLLEIYKKKIVYAFDYYNDYTGAGLYCQINTKRNFDNKMEKAQNKYNMLKNSLKKYIDKK